MCYMLLSYRRDNNDVAASQNMNITHFGLHPKVEKVKTISELLSSATSMIDRVNDLLYRYSLPIVVKL